MTIEMTEPKRRNGHIILVVGAPGAGKGTMCKRLAVDDSLRTIRGPTTPINIHHISVGDLLRRAMSAGALPPHLVDKVERQVLMAGDELVGIIASAAGVGDRLGRRGEVVVLDGFPRNMDQLHAFGERFGHPDLLISLGCSRQLALERYLGRHDASRPDGSEALFGKRCDEFERENTVILEYYKAECGGRVLEVDIGSSGATTDENYMLLRQLLIQHEQSPWHVSRD